MGKHAVQINYPDKKRYSNDPKYHQDEESRLLNLLQNYWRVANTQDIKPYFYLTEKDITHDLSVAPAIVLYNIKDDSKGIGIGYPAKYREKVMAIEIFSMDRGLLYDTKEEAIRIIDFCRKRPIIGWDYMYTTLAKRAEPRAGNHHFIINLTLHRLVEWLPSTDQWTWSSYTPPELNIEAEFHANVVSGASPLEITFTDDSEGTPTAWLWEMNNTTYDTQNPVVIFSIPGAYDVKLTITNDTGKSSIVKTAYINVN